MAALVARLPIWQGLVGRISHRARERVRERDADSVGDSREQ
jgi:hypothetical protein